jgi:hypothetical protein
MKFNNLAMVMMLGGAGVMLNAPLTASAQVQQLDADINIIPDKTTKTEAGIRISLCIIGLPRATQRIDDIDLMMETKKVKATNVEGIEFEKEFTIPDDGVLVIDVDFPYQGTLSKTAHLIFHTPHGDIETPARQ